MLRSTWQELGAPYVANPKGLGHWGQARDVNTKNTKEEELKKAQPPLWPGWCWHEVAELKPGASWEAQGQEETLAR